MLATVNSHVPALTGAQKVIQQRWYFSEPLVARQHSVGKPLGLPCGAYATTRGANAWAEPKKNPAKKSWSVLGYWLLVSVILKTFSSH